MRTLNGDLKKIDEITRPIAEKWLKENSVDYLNLILGKPWCGNNGWYVDDKNLNIEEFTFKFSGPYWKNKVDLIVPFFNEAGNIQKAHVENKKSERLFNINNFIYIENGSTDQTRNELSELASQDPKVKLVLLENNMGYGGGIKAGLKISSSQIIILNHADLQFDLYSFIYANLEIIKSNKKISILPKRLNRTYKENINSSFLRILLSVILGKRIMDFNGQPKIFDKSLLGQISALPDNFCIDLAIYMKISTHSLQLPILQTTRKAGKSSWSSSLKNRIKIFFAYILWAIINR